MYYSCCMFWWCSVESVLWKSSRLQLLKRENSILKTNSTEQPSILSFRSMSWNMTSMLVWDTNKIDEDSSSITFVEYCKDRILIEIFQHWFRKILKELKKSSKILVSTNFMLDSSKRLLHSKFYWKKKNWIRRQHRGWPVWCPSGDNRARFSQADTRQGCYFKFRHTAARRRACALRGSARGPGASGPPAASSLIVLPQVPCGASHGAGCAGNQVPVTVAAMLVPLARVARAAPAVSARAGRQRSGHRSVTVLFQSLVSEFCFKFKCPLAELPAFQVCHTRAVTGRNSSYVLICPIRTMHVMNTYMVFYVQTMYRRVQIVRNTCNLHTFIWTWYMHIRANTFTTGQRSV